MGNVLDLRELRNITEGFINGITYETIFPCAREDFVPGALLSSVRIVLETGTVVTEFNIWYENNKTMYDNLQLPPWKGKKQVRYFPTTVGGVVQYEGYKTHWVPTVVFSYHLGYLVLENNNWHNFTINYACLESPYDLIESCEIAQNRAFVDYIRKLFV